MSLGLRWMMALFLIASVGCSAAPEDGRPSQGTGGATGTGGVTGAQPAYFDMAGNPVTTLYDANGNVVTAGSYEGPLYDQAGNPVFDGFGAPAFWGAGGGGTGGTTFGPTVDAGGDEGCSSVEETAEVERGAVDIIWIIDNSCSMADEIAAVQNNINNFANQISLAGVDHHVVMMNNSDVAAGTPLGGDPNHYLFLNMGVGSHDALDLLLSQFNQYSGFLRPEAPTHFVAVTDDEAFLPAAQFQTQMEALLGHEFIFHAIASEDAGGGAACLGACGIPFACGAAAPGLQFYALADSTGGEKISICVADWSMVFGPLQDAVIASVPLPCDYNIPPPPSGESLDPALVNVEYTAPDATVDDVFPRADTEAECGSHTAWYYDDPADPTVIHLCPEACTVASNGGTLRIVFGCASVPVE